MDREVVGPYRLIRLLGKGGMGAVFEALHQTIERRAAIKILHPEFASNQEYTERFMNEARAANRIGHPSIVAIYDTGTLPDGTAYLVMEFLDGETLTQRLRRQGGKLPIPEALWIGLEIAGAIGAAHKKGIIHRDLKPDNIMLISDSESLRGERVKLLDFGIAKFAIGSASDKAATQIGTVMGTLSYMPPEQLRDTAQVTDRADVYALGALLYQMLSGQPPFVAANHIDLMAMHLRDEAPPLASVEPEVPAELARLVAGMLAKEASRRPSMAEVTQRLLEQLRAAGNPTTDQPPGVSQSRTSGPVPATIVHRSSAAAGPLGEVQAAAPDPGLAVPSASTLSGSAGQSAGLAVAKRAVDRRWYLLAAALPVVLVLSMTRLHRPAKTAPAVSPRKVESILPVPGTTSTGGAPNDVVAALPIPTAPPTPIAPPTAPPNPTALPTAQAAPTDPPVAHPAAAHRAAGPHCQRAQVVISCVASGHRLMPLPTLDAVVRASRLAGLKPCAGQKLRAVREGKKMVFEPAHVVSTNLAIEFSDTLRGLLPPGSALPSEVIFQCGK